MDHFNTKTRNGCWLALLLLLATMGSTLYAQTNYGAFQDNNFLNPNNWTNGLPGPGNDGTIVGGVSANIGAAITIDYTLTSYGTLTASADVTISAGGTLNNYSGSSFTISGGATLTNAGTMDQRGALNISPGATFQNTGTYSSTGSATLTNDGILTLDGNFDNLGTLTNNATLNIDGGNIHNNTALINLGTLNFNGGTLTNVNGAQLTNETGATLNHATGAVLENLGGGTATNRGTWQNTGEINSNGNFVNEGLFNNNANGSFDNFFKLNNNGTFNNNNQSNLLNEFEINNSGEFNNNFFLDNGAYVNNLAGGTFNNAGLAQINNQFGASIVNSALFSNQGEIISVGDVVNHATFSNDGSIYTNTGGGVINHGNFHNNVLLNNLEIIENFGTFWNNGQLMNDSGGSFTNKGELYNEGSARISNQFDLINDKNLYNSGTIENGVRVFNNDYFENNGYLINIGELVNGPLAIFENAGTGVIDNANGGVFTNEGVINNNNEIFNLECSSFVNKGIINNYYWFTNKSLFFNFGTFNALPYALMNMNGGVEITGPTSQFVCESINANLDESGQATLTGTAVAISYYDDCTTLNLTLNGTNSITFTCADQGEHVVTLEIADRTGNSVSCEAKVNIVDNTGPTFQNCPADIVVTTNGDTAPANWTAPTATDNCGPVTISSTHNPGDIFPKGNTLVTYSATDGAGNGAAICTFTVSVIPEGDCSEVLAVRRVTNTQDLCGSWCDGEYAFARGNDKCYTAGEDLYFIEYTDGTALLTGSISRGSNRIAVDVRFEGRTNTPPAGSPKLELCVTEGGDGWVYYTAFEGTLTAKSGEHYHISRYGPAFQLGKGANLQDPDLLGASGWISMDGGSSHGGDFNFRLSDPLPCQNSLALEAECADAIGDRWTVMNDNEASNGQYLLPPNQTSYDYPPLNTEDLLRFQFEVEQSGHYRIYFRSQNANGASDSYWLRTNYGNWVKWNRINVDDYDHNFHWDQAGSWCGGSAAQAQTFYLEAGTNTLEIAWREPNALLDKIFVTLSGKAPHGFGPDAQNCGSTNPPPACEPVTIQIKPDYYGSDITWNLKDETGNVLASGGPYQDGNTELKSTSVCLPDGCYTFNIYDSYGDGICCSYGDGWYSLKNAAGETLAANGNYDTHESKSFCIGEVPPPACNKTALFVVGDLDLHSADVVLLEHLQGLGFEVTVVEDEEVESSDSDGKGIVLVSSTCTSGKIDDRLTNINVPILNCEAWLFDDLKMTGPEKDWDYGLADDIEDIEIINDAHPIAQGASGTIKVLTKDQKVSWGFPAPTATKIGVVPGYPECVMLFTYDKGAEMVGMTAPARRVGFFLHNSTAKKLNATGWLLFDRAVEWATGCDLSNGAKAQEEVLALNAMKADRQVNLYWANNTGFKNDRFLVEKSTDGVHFETLLELPAYYDEDNSTKLFETLDPEPATGYNYYRVKAVHLDGSISVSEVKMVEMNAIARLALYPNPARSYTRINFEDFDKEGPISIRISDLAGKVLSTIKLDAPELPYYELQLDQLQTGQYLLSITPEGRRPIVQKLVVIKD